MLTADQFDTLTDPIVALYNEYETSIITDIARRLGNLDFSSAAWQVQRLTESGALYKEVLAQLAKQTGKSEATLREIFKKAGVKAISFDDKIYKAAGLNPLPLNLSPAMLRALTAGLQKTQGILSNLTLTTAVNAQRAFIKAADLAYLQVSTGAMSYDQAIKLAVKKMAAEGLSTVDYASGHTDKIDVAMRRTVLTGVSQTTAILQEQRAGEMGSDLVQVSAHVGARNTGTGPENHEAWQGKIFSRSGKHPKYPDFEKVTGFGTGEGLAGWNCRHSFFPFFEGLSESAYSREELKEIKKETVTYNGKEISNYEGTQYQRGLERKIRHWKRQADALKAAGQDNTFELSKVKGYQAEMRDFIKQTGLDRQSVRESIVSGGGVANTPPAPVVAPVQPVAPVEVVKTPTIQEFENRIVKQDYETAGLYSQDGKLIFEKTDNIRDHVYFTEEQLSKMKGAILTHNHPASTQYTFSKDDLNIFSKQFLQEIRAVSDDYICILSNDKNVVLRDFRIQLLFQKANQNVLENNIIASMSQADWRHLVNEEYAKLANLTYKRIPR